MHNPRVFVLKDKDCQILRRLGNPPVTMTQTWFVGGVSKQLSLNDSLEIGLVDLVPLEQLAPQTLRLTGWQGLAPLAWH